MMRKGDYPDPEKLLAAYTDIAESVNRNGGLLSFEVNSALEHIIASIIHTHVKIKGRDAAIEAREIIIENIDKYVGYMLAEQDACGIPKKTVN